MDRHCYEVRLAASSPEAVHVAADGYAVHQGALLFFVKQGSLHGGVEVATHTFAPGYWREVITMEANLGNRRTELADAGRVREAALPK
jgi:hypothetical protein